MMNLRGFILIMVIFAASCSSEPDLIPTSTPTSTLTPTPVPTVMPTPSLLLHDNMTAGEWLASDRSEDIGTYFSNYWRKMGSDVPLTDQEMQLCLEKKISETPYETMLLMALAGDCICDVGSSEQCEPDTAEQIEAEPTPLTVAFPDLNRNTEAYVNQEIIVKGQVIQVVEEQGSYTVRLAVDNNFDQIILALCYPETRILENDQLTVIGLVMGRDTYTSVLGQSITLPWIFAKSCTIQ